MPPVERVLLEVLLDVDEEADEEVTEVFGLGVSTFIFDICFPVASHSPL